MATHSNILTWRIPLPTPVFWPGEFHGLYCPWGHKESDTTEQFSLSLWAITKNVTKTVICFPFFPVNSQCLYVISCTHNPVPSVQFSPVTQSCWTLCDPMDYTVHGILQARILEWVVLPFSRGSSQPRDWTQVSCIGIAGRFFASWATRGAQNGQGVQQVINQSF